MPYYRRFRRRRYPYRRRFRRYRRRGYQSTRILSKRITGLARSMRPEMKFHDVTATDSDIYDTATVVNLTDISQGDSYTMRDGREITIKSIQFKGMIQQDTDTAGVTNLYRIILLIDRETDGTAPTWLNVYNSENVWSIRDADVSGVNTYRFKVIFDKVVSTKLDADGTSNEKRLIKFYKKLNLKCSWRAQGTDPKNGIYLMFLGTSATTVTDFSYQSRVRFVDK